MDVASYDGGCGNSDCELCKADFDATLQRYRLLNDLDEGDCVDCGAHEEQACEFDCLTRRLATEEDVTDDSNG